MALSILYLDVDLLRGAEQLAQLSLFELFRQHNLPHFEVSLGDIVALR